MRKQNGGHSDLLEIQARIPAGGAVLDGDLMIPSGASGIAVFAHGSGSSRHSPRNRSVASVIREAGVGTLLFDLLTREEESVDVFTRHLRFDIELLTGRLIDATRWLAGQEETRNLQVGYFGSSTGAAAALKAAAGLGEEIGAVVSRGGRPDLAGDSLPLVKAPTLWIVGGDCWMNGTKSSVTSWEGPNCPSLSTRTSCSIRRTVQCGSFRWIWKVA